VDDFIRTFVVPQEYEVTEFFIFCV